MRCVCANTGKVNSAGWGPWVCWGPQAHLTWISTGSALEMYSEKYSLGPRQRSPDISGTHQVMASGSSEHQAEPVLYPHGQQDVMEGNTWTLAAWKEGHSKDLHPELLGSIRKPRSQA